MTLFGGVISVSGITFFLLFVFAIAFLGFALGRIKIKGVSLGDAGVFIVALVFGCFFYQSLDKSLSGFALTALKIVENLGLILFVTSVGFIAGPKFFSNMKRNFKSYVILGIIIPVTGGLTAIGCIYLGYALGEPADGSFTAMIVGLLSGAITSTPAFSAAKATVIPEYESLVSVGHGISYTFGVVSAVLFVQLVPKIMKANMDEERKKLTQVSAGEVRKEYKGKLISLDGLGFGAFALAAALGCLLGSVKIPLTASGYTGTCFALTTTGGCLLAALLFGHLGRIGAFNITPKEQTLKILREIGLMLFLVGAGVPGGADFVKYFDPMYFVYGIIMTIPPLFVGFFFAKYVLKLSLLNNLGAITGGRTTTPSLGVLINLAKTEDVALAYAATYPVALITIVLICQFIIILF